MRPYSSTSTGGEGTGTVRSDRRDAHVVDDQVRRRPGLHADSVSGRRVAATVAGRLLQVLDRQDLDAVDQRAEVLADELEAHEERAVHRRRVVTVDARDRVPQLSVGVP